MKLLDVVVYSQKAVFGSDLPVERLLLLVLLGLETLPGIDKVVVAFVTA